MHKNEITNNAKQKMQCGDMHIITDNMCSHKDLFPPNINDLAMTIAVFCSSIFTTIAGIGGGGLLLPIYLLIGDFGTEHTIPLTVITIAGSSFIRMIILFDKRHNNGNGDTVKRYLIDYGAILLIVPFDGNTAFIGMILNTIAPAWLVLSSILVILSIITVKTIIKARRLYKLEKQNNTIMIPTQQIAHSNTDVVIDGISFTIDKTNEPVSTETISVDGIDISIERGDSSLEQLSIETGDKSVHRFKNMGMLGGIFALLILFTFFREKMNERCSVTYWTTYFAQFVVMLFMGMMLIARNVNKYNNKHHGNFRFVRGDIRWDYKVGCKFAIFASMTGIVSTYLGIGGGMLIGPFLLSTGMTPVVVAATDSVTTFFSSTASSVQYIVTGRVLPYYSVYFFVLSAIASNLGLKISSYIVRKIERQSIIVMILGALIFISTVLLLTSGLLDPELKFDGFKGFCNATSSSSTH